MRVMGRTAVNVIHIDTNDPIGTISPHLYGCLFSSCYYGMVEANSPIPNEGGFRTDLIEAMRRARIGMLQWPAGDQAEYYLWRDGIGPRSERPLRKSNKWFPGCDDMAFAPEDNAMGTHEFLHVCERVGAEPYMGVSICYGSVADFHQWVEYCNCPYDTALSRERRANGREEPFRVRYWYLNNQGGYITTEEYAAQVRRYFGFIPFFDTNPVRVARVDRADGTRRFFRNWRERGVYQWMDYVPAPWNNLNPGVDALCYIRYGTTGPSTGFDTEQWYRSMAYGLGFQEWIDDKREEFKESFNPQMGVGLNEWGCMHNTSYIEENLLSLRQKDTVRDGLAAATALNVFNGNCDFLRFACLSDMINGIHHAFEVDETAGGALITTPTGLVFELYAPHQGGTCVRTRAQVPDAARIASATTSTVANEEATVSIPQLQASASLKERTLTVTVVNTDRDRGVESEVRVSGAEPGEASAVVLTHEDPAALNGAEAPERVHLLDAPASMTAGKLVHRFPAHSVTRLTVALR